MPQSKSDLVDPLDCEFIELERPADWQERKKSDQTIDELRRRGVMRRAGMKQPLFKKIDYALRVIERALAKPGVNWYVSFSAGNDSHVVSHLVVDVLGFKTPHIMSNTRLEYPHTYRNLKRWRQRLSERDVELHVALPDKRPQQVWAEDGIPLFSKELTNKYRQWLATGNDNHLRKVPKYLHEKFRALREEGVILTDRCCDELKKNPMRKLCRRLGFDGTITGTRMAESNARQLAFIQQGSLYYSSRNGQWIANPLSHWLAEDVKQYHRDRGIVVEQIPTETGRSGCVNCGFGCHLAQRDGVRNSLQILHDMNPAMWKKTMDEWGFRKACEIAGIEFE